MLTWVKPISNPIHIRACFWMPTCKMGTERFVSSMKDPNLTYQLNAEAAFTEKYPSLKIKLQLDTIECCRHFN